MKTFCKKIALYFCVFLILDILVCAVVDPYNVMHVDQIRDNGVEPNKNYIKMSYILRNPDKFDSFVFGSSRVGSLHVEKMENERCYNMNYSAGLPEEHLDNLRTLTNAGIVPKKVYLGVDSISYTDDPVNHYSQGLRIPYEYLSASRLRFIKAYFDPAIVRSAVFQVIRLHTPEDGFVERFYKYGWNAKYNSKTTYDFEHATPLIGTSMRIEESLEAISKIVELCEQNGIELVVFTNPMYSVTYKASLERDYLVFLKGLAGVTPFYNFSGYNSITTDSRNFTDSSHYTAEVGDMLINCMCYDYQYPDLYEEGFGVYVSENNIDELLAVLSSQVPA